MKEMIYTEDMHDPEILDEGKHRGVKYVVLSLGTHPTAYVENIVKAYSDTDERLRVISVHGGFTYLGPDYWNTNKRHATEYIGWDYAHSGDFVGWHTHCVYLAHDKQWITPEIVFDCKTVIDQFLNLIEYEKTIKRIESQNKLKKSKKSLKNS